MNIYVGNLPYSTNSDNLREIFEGYGQVATVSIVSDKFTGQSRGFGFVEMENDDEARAAIEALNGMQYSGRALVANEARPREERRSGGGGGRRDNNRGGGFRRNGEGGGKRERY